MYKRISMWKVHIHSTWRPVKLADGKSWWPSEKFTPKILCAEMIFSRMFLKFPRKSNIKKSFFLLSMLMLLLNPQMSLHLLTVSQSSEYFRNWSRSSWTSGLMVDTIELSWITILTTSLCSATILWRGLMTEAGLIFTSSPPSNAWDSSSWGRYNYALSTKGYWYGVDYHLSIQTQIIVSYCIRVLCQWF